MEALLMFLFGSAVIGFGLLESRGRMRTWERAVTAQGLQVLETASFLKPWIRAYSGPLEVRIESHGDKGRLTRILVLAPGPPDFQDVRIRPEPMFRLGREHEIGDAYFDSLFFLEGPAQLVFALLDKDTRRLLADLKDKVELEIASGEIRAVLSKDESVSGVLPLLLDLRKRFSPPIEVRQRLAENATRDSDPGVRLHNLLLLIRELPDNPGTAEALRKACSDSSPEIRLRAALALGAEGRGVLRELAESAEHDPVSAEAVQTVEAELPFESIRGILERALSRRRVRTARACLEAIGRGGDPAAVGVLAKVLEQEYGELAPIAARALGETGSPAAELALIAVLQREEEDVQVAAADALGRVGTVAAVLPLKEMADRFLPGDTRRAARQAIAEIQSRVQGAAPGQLSLAGAEAGQLSLAEDPAGQLSLPPEERPA